MTRLFCIAASLCATAVMSVATYAQRATNFEGAFGNLAKSAVVVESDHPTTVTHTHRRIFLMTTDSGDGPAHFPQIVEHSDSQSDTGAVHRVGFAVAEDLILLPVVKEVPLEIRLPNGDTVSAQPVVIDRVIHSTLVRIPPSGLSVISIADAPPSPGVPVIIPAWDDEDELTVETSLISSGQTSKYSPLGHTHRLSGVYQAQRHGAPILDSHGHLLGLYGRGSKGTETSAVCISREAVRRMIRIADPTSSPEPVVQLQAGRIGLELAGDDRPAVKSVLPGTPAEESGMQQGDVIVSVNGSVCQTRSDVIAAVNDARAGEKVRVTGKRDEVDVQWDFVLASAPDHDNHAYWFDSRVPAVAVERPSRPGSPISVGPPGVIGPPGSVAPPGSLVPPSHPTMSGNPPPTHGTIPPVAPNINGVPPEAPRLYWYSDGKLTPMDKAAPTPPQVIAPTARIEAFHVERSRFEEERRKLESELRAVQEKMAKLQENLQVKLQASIKEKIREAASEAKANAEIRGWKDLVAPLRALQQRMDKLEAGQAAAATTPAPSKKNEPDDSQTDRPSQ